MNHLMMIGCGKMGGAILEGLLKAFPKMKVSIIEPRYHAEKAQRFKAYDVSFYENLGAFPESLMPDAIMFAIKPQIADDIFKEMNNHPRLMSALGISIIAGKTLDQIGAFLSKPMPMIRIMPNTPSAVQQGVFLLAAHALCNEMHVRMATELFESIGDVYHLPQEEHIDPLTTISGCGPAYIFLLLEVLTKASEKLGMDADLSLDLAKKTILGSAALAIAADEKPDQLRRNVASPGGMTAEALNVLMDKDALQNLFSEALEAAFNRAKELQKV